MEGQKTIQELAIIKLRTDSMEEKLVELNKKIDNLTEKILDPDYGVTSRVNQNTAVRKNIVKALWVLYVLVMGALVKLFIN